MAAAVPAKIHKLILDIKDCIKELQNEFTTSGMPIDEDSTSLHNFCTKLEYLLLVGMKENYSLFGSRKLYWEYFCKCLASRREIHDGLIFVKSIPEFKTSLGRGRAFIRYCLVHQCLADTLQQCFQNTIVTRDYYTPESLQLQQEQLSYLLSIVYDLNEIQFDLSSHGHDLDVSWPTFARKVFGSPSRWRAPSRTASLTSLISVTSQQNEVMQSFKNNGGEGSQNRSVSDLDSSTEVVAVADVERRCESDQTESSQRNVVGDEHHDETNIQKSESLVQNSATTMDVPINHDEGAQKKDLTDNSVSSENSLKEVNDNKSTPLESDSGSHCPSQGVCNQSCSPSNQTVKDTNEHDLLLVEVKNLREENELLKDRAEKWKKVVSGFSEKLAIKEKVNGHLEKQVHALKESVAALKEIMQVKMAEANSLKRMVEEFKALRNVESNANNAEEKIRTLECENSNLKEELSNLNVNFEKLKMDLSSKLKLLDVQVTPAPTVDAGSSTIDLPQDDAKCEVVQLTGKLEASYLENQKLTCRLNKMQQILSQVEKAEEELEKLEAAEGNSSNFNSLREESDDVESPQTDNDGDNSEFGHNEPTVNFVLCDQPVIFPEDSLVFTVVNRTVSRLKRLISEKNDLQLQLRSSNEMNNSLISKMQEQEEQLSTVVFELSEAKSLVEQLKKSHSKLQTAEAILRYELKEKRSVVERMKHMLESSRTQWMRIRQKHAESEVEWHSLRADFANRVKQESMESGFVEDITTDRSDERESSVVPDDDTDKQLQSPTPSDSPNFPSDPVDVVPARLPLSSPTGTGELEDLPESPREEDDEDLSSSDGERRRNTRTRLRIMEEQCQQLYSRLVASVKKSEFLEWKLSELHEQHGPGDVDPTPKETTAETLVKDVNSNFDALFVPYSSDAGHSSSITPVDDMLELRDSIGEGDRDTTPTEGEISESFSCDMDGVTVEDVGSPSTDQLSQNSVIDGDLMADDSSEPLDKPPPLILAKALPKRIVLLRKKKEDLEEHMKKMTEEKTISEAREADLLSQLETLRALVSEKDSHINSLTSEKADLIQRETEFKRRAEFIMRKEREGNDALDKVNQNLESKLNSLYGEIQERQEMISTLEGDLRKSSEEHLASILTLQQEVASLKFQLSSETLQREIALKSHEYHKDQIISMQKQITEQEQSISGLEKEMEEIKVDRDNEKDQHRLELNELKMCLTSREEECAALNDNLKVLTRQYDNERNQSSHLAAMCKELKGDNIKLKEEREELTGDLLELKKKMIKLIKEKDLLWKRSERLNFIQKVQASDRWLKDEEVTHCLGCKTEFSLIIRKHHCRLCGRIFCSTCCNHWAMTTSSSRKVRVCGECLLNHSHIEPDSVGVDSDDDDESASSVTNDSFIGPPSSHENADSNIADLPEGNASGSMPMNIPFIGDFGDVANVNDVAVSTPCSGSLSPNNSTCQEDKSIRENSSLLGRLFASWSLSPKSKMIPDDEEEFYVLSDEEIMRSLSHSSPYAPLAGEHPDPGVHICPTRHVDDLINEFSNDMPREFWVNAGKSYVLPVSITNKIGITWEFTTEPKSIAFSLVFRAATSEEDEEAIDEDISIDPSNFLPPTEVLIPVTHCESHLHPIRGKLIAKKPGVYTFYFDNGFSRFMAKKVKFIMRLFKEECKDKEKPSEDQCSVPDCANSLETT